MNSQLSIISSEEQPKDLNVEEAWQRLTAQINEAKKMLRTRDKELHWRQKEVVRQRNTLSSSEET